MITKNKTSNLITAYEWVHGYTVFSIVLHQIYFPKLFYCAHYASKPKCFQFYRFDIEYIDISEQKNLALKYQRPNIQRVTLFG